MNQPTWREKFDEKFCDENGYVITGELSTTKLKHFIQSELSQQRKEIVEEIKGSFEDVICLTDKKYNKAFTTICFKGTEKGANLVDIITKLSSEEA